MVQIATPLMTARKLRGQMRRKFLENGKTKLLTIDQVKERRDTITPTWEKKFQNVTYYEVPTKDLKNIAPFVIAYFGKVIVVDSIFGTSGYSVTTDPQDIIYLVEFVGIPRRCVAIIPWTQAMEDKYASNEVIRESRGLIKRPS
jgi:hypothetical protein